MTDLLARIDRFVDRLLTDAERGCETPREGDTSTTEDSPGSVPLSERVAALKAVTSYLALRFKLSDPDEDTGDKEPGIVSFERSVNRKRRASGR